MIKYLITLIFFALASLANAQIYSYNKDVNAVFKAILKSSPDIYKVNFSTRNAAFKVSEFRQPQYHRLDTNLILIISSAEWKGFLNSIDTAKISEYKLSTWFLKKQKLRFLFTPTGKSFLTFSSPVFLMI